MKDNKKYFDFIVDRWKPYWKFSIFLTFFTLLNTAIVLYYPYLLKYIINGLQNHIEPEILKKYVILLVLSGIGIAIVYSILQQSRLKMNLIFANETRDRAFTKFFTYKNVFFQDFDSGDISTRLVVDNESLSWFLSSGIFRGIEGLFLVVFGTIILLQMNIILTVISMVPLFSIIVILLFTTEEKLRKKFRVVQDFISKVSNFIGTSFSGIILVKTKNRIPVFSKMLRDLLKERKIKEIDAIKYERSVDLAYGTGITLSIVLFLFFGGRIAVSGKLSLGDFVAFVTYLTILIEPMFSLGFFVVSYARSRAYIDRLSEIQSPKHLEFVERHLKKENFENNIILQNISCGTRNNPILEDIDLEIRSGEKIGIVGDVGSGKTTLLKLIISIVQPDKGEILIDNISIGEIDYNSINKLFGYTPQGNYLFSTTIRENITFHKNRITEKKILEAIDISLFKNDLIEYNMDLENKIGTGGKAISGGQQQRISIA
ncbi:ABC transporter ATP-binding protein, partial [bacterium]|nr:ABC transporter ATP-binding protein [bacterium]